MCFHRENVYFDITTTYRENKEKVSREGVEGFTRRRKGFHAKAQRSAKARRVSRKGAKTREGAKL